MSRRVFVHIGLPKTGTSYLQSVVWPHRGMLLRSRAAGAGAGEARPPAQLDDRPRRPGRAAPWTGRGRGVGRRTPGDRRARRRRPGEPRVLLRGVGRPGGADGRGPGAGRGARRGHRSRAAGAVHLQLAGVAEEPRHHAAGGLRPHGVRRPARRLGLAVPRPRPGARPLVAGRAARSGCTWSWRRVPGCPARSCGGGSPACSGSTPTWCRTRRRSPTRRWAWSRPRRCAGSTRTSARFRGAYDRGRWIRTFLADERLVTRGGERYWPGDDQVADARRARRPRR